MKWKLGTHGLASLAAVGSMVGALLVAVPMAENAHAAANIDGLTEATAAASCWEIKQLASGSADGTYWVVTPEMAAPQQIFCDMTTDGGGWALVGKGRNGWVSDYDGKGSPATLRTAGVSPMSQVTTQFSSKSIDGLLNGQRVDSLDDGVRIKRARTTDGSAWQEVRMKLSKMDGWSWTFGALNPMSYYEFDGNRRNGSNTNSFGRDNAFQRVTSSPISSQGFAAGFAYGSGVSGSSSSTSYVWSRTDGAGEALPYSEVYVRPKVRSDNAGWVRIGDEGTASQTIPSGVRSRALNSPWGVASLGHSSQREGDVEVQAMVESNGVVYVGGNFRYVQKANNSTGADKVEQPYLSAFDISSGELIRTFTPRINGSVMALAALPDGKIVVGGSFSEVNGQAANLVALNPTTGQTDSVWKATVQNNTSAGSVTIRTLSIEDQWLYLGGSFTHISGGTRYGNFTYMRNAGRVSVADGTQGLNWNPDLNGTVVASDASDDGARFYAAGYFTTSRSNPALKTAAVLSSSGATLATPSWDPVWSNSNKNYQQAIKEIGDSVWVGGSEHSLFEFSSSTFERGRTYIEYEKGDLQTISTGNGNFYAGCHCNSYSYDGATAWPSLGTSWQRADSIGWIGEWNAATGDYNPHFTPTISMRLGSGPWASLVDSSGTLWVGGDITGVAADSSTGRWAGGFARFPKLDSQAPSAPGNFTLAQDQVESARLTWGASTDSGGSVSYQVLRDDRVIATTTARALTVPKGGENRFFVRAVDSQGNLSASSAPVKASGGNAAPVPEFDHSAVGKVISFDASQSTDDGQIVSYSWQFGDESTGSSREVSHEYPSFGEYKVTLTVEDDSGSVRSITKTVQLLPGVPADAYGAQIYKDEPLLYWRLNEQSGGLIEDSSVSLNNGLLSGATALGEHGVSSLIPGTAAKFSGDSNWAASQTRFEPTNVYSLEGWFKTTSTQGGKLIGFGNNQTSLSDNYDRHVYMRNDGTLIFGTYNGGENVATSTAAYNDGGWHHMVATQSNDGMKLYVDGAKVAENPQSQAESYSGYWRIGGDRVWGGSSSNYFQGTMDDVAVYAAALSSGQVSEHYRLGIGAPVPENELPIAQFTADADYKNLSVDASDSTDPDGQITKYQWAFGDGKTAEGISAEHEYAQAGSYDVVLTVTDNRGGTAAKTVVVEATEAPAPADTEIVAKDAKWSWYFQFDAPPTNWKTQAFIPTGWTVGSAALGWGSSGIATDIRPANWDQGTEVRPRTAYFVKDFDVVDASKAIALTMTSIADDGVVIYVNGVEVARSNMPTGTITHNSYASSARRNTVANQNPVDVSVPISLLTNGTNRISAETHVNFRSTPDATFELKAILSSR